MAAPPRLSTNDKTPNFYAGRRSIRKLAEWQKRIHMKSFQRVADGSFNNFRGQFSLLVFRAYSALR